MSIHVMPDLCLVTIFCRVPLRDRIRAGQVCSRWRWLWSVTAFQVRSLSIFVGPKAESMVLKSEFNPPSLLYHVRNDDGTNMLKTEKLSKWNSLKFESFNAENLYGLVFMFRNIRTLKFALDKVNVKQLMYAANLCQLNAPKLTTLKIYCNLADFDRCFPKPCSQHLFSCVNSLSSLKHLTLEFSTNFALSRIDIARARGRPYDDNVETTSVDLPIISQLDEFNFFTPDDERADLMFDSFRRYAQHSQRPLKIQYGYYDHASRVSKLVQLGSQFCHRFTLLVSYDSAYISTEHDLTEFESICSRFGSLTCIAVSVDNITIRHFIKSMAQLTQLVHVDLNVWFPDVLTDESSNDIYRQLPSVKSLELSICPTNHENISELNIPWTFPNVQVMCLSILNEVHSCDICMFDRDENVEIPLDRLKHCYEQILSHIQIHLRQCAHLHTITDFVADPFKAIKSPITKQDLMQPIELEISD